MSEVKTKATSGMIIKYNKKFGLKVDNDAIKKHALYFRNALVRANYNDLKNGIHATTKYLEMFFNNLLMGTDYELKNRYMHVDYVPEQDCAQSQSINSKVPKVQNDTLKCTLEEMAVMRLISENPMITQKELVKITGKSISTVKRIMNSLQEKGYVRRVNGKRYGKWEVLIKL